MSGFNIRSICRGLALAVVLLVVVPSRADVRMVDDDAPPGGDGQSWATAYKYLQDALAAAQASGGTITEIRVAAGTYKPDQGQSQTPGDRDATFQLLNGVALQGGYAGLGAPDPDERDITVYETILSGDIGTIGNAGDNSCHVTTGSYTDSTAVLDGFTVTGGNADGFSASPPYGGGMFNNWDGHPTIRNCTFRENVAGSLSDPGGAGGGVFSGHGQPTLVDCTFVGNRALDGTGGGLAVFCGIGLTLIRCRFIGNSDTYGGGMYIDGGSTVLIDCVFSENSADWGGGIYGDGYKYYTAIALTNCQFSGNRATCEGGAIYSSSDVLLTPANCTFSGNTAASGRALACDSLIHGFPSTLQLANCILWDGGDEIWNNDGSTITFTYSDVQGGVVPGDGNISADPLFVDADGPDGVAGTADDNLRLGRGSPCIDAGNTTAVPGGVTTDLDGKPRFVDDPATEPNTGLGDPPVDMGVYEVQLPLTIYVDDSATGGANNGTSWTDAFIYLQDALAAVPTCGSNQVSIRVAAGTYKPDHNTVNPSGTGSRSATFCLRSGVSLQGGYAGFWAPDPNERDIAAYETILSGDIGTIGDTGDNSYHVTTGSYTDSTAVIDGFTVAGGSANGTGRGHSGGGMTSVDGSPTVFNCTFTGNWASGSGGGVDIGGGNPTLVDCKFIHNTSDGHGGGVSIGLGGATLTRCTFSENSGVVGGAMCLSTGTAALTDCIFGKNSAVHGGGVHVNGGSLLALAGCLFSGNTAGVGGGAILSYLSVVLTAANCTFSGNMAANGRALACDQWGGDPSALQLANCILWDGGDEIWNNDGSDIIITYSDVQDGFPGDGNINADPRFIDADGPDDVVGTADDDLRLGLDSPCIDAGTNEAVPGDVLTDLDGNPRFFDVRCILDTGSGEPPIVDMGPYEFPTEVPSSVRADYDGDCDVDQYDRDLFEWCASGPGMPLPPSTACLYVADFDGDSDADQSDFAIFQRCYSGEGIPAKPDCAE